MKEIEKDVLRTGREPRASDTPKAKRRRNRVLRSGELCIDPNAAKWLRRMSTTKSFTLAIIH